MNMSNTGQNIMDPSIYFVQCW